MEIDVKVDFMEGYNAVFYLFSYTASSLRLTARRHELKTP